MHSLLHKPTARAFQDLGRFDRALAAALPLKTRHRKDLPLAVQELSALLTVERGQRKAYWSSPRFLSAYMRYFLPWNLVRLSWLLPGLPLFPQGPGKVLDLGSGPLTLPLGLWLARPELRDVPLSFVCADTAARPMEAGREVYNFLRGDQNKWQFSLLNLPMEKALAQTRDKVRLITALNVFNEIGTSRRESLEERLEGIFGRMDRTLEPGGQILLMEPGTRLGGKIIGLLRRIALNAGFSIEAPCPHSGPCPYLPDQPERAELAELADPPVENAQTDRLGTKRPRPQFRASGWCHFSHPARWEGPEQELQKLSNAAGLAKDQLHLSCLLLRKSREPRQAQPESKGKISVRIISDLIRLPDRAPARYGCSELGLILLEEAAGQPSGSLVLVPAPRSPQRDAKSGALILRRESGAPDRTQSPPDRSRPRR